MLSTVCSSDTGTTYLWNYVLTTLSADDRSTATMSLGGLGGLGLGHGLGLGSFVSSSSSSSSSFFVLLITEVLSLSALIVSLLLVSV